MNVISHLISQSPLIEVIDQPPAPSTSTAGKPMQHERGVVVERTTSACRFCNHGGRQIGNLRLGKRKTVIRPIIIHRLVKSALDNCPQRDRDSPEPLGATSAIRSPERADFAIRRRSQLV